MARFSPAPTGLEIGPQVPRWETTQQRRDRERIDHARDIMEKYDENVAEQNPQNLAEKCIYVAKLRRDNYNFYKDNLNNQTNNTAINNTAINNTIINNTLN